MPILHHNQDSFFSTFSYLILFLMPHNFNKIHHEIYGSKYSILRQLRINMQVSDNQQLTFSDQKYNTFFRSMDGRSQVLITAFHSSMDSRPSNLWTPIHRVAQRFFDEIHVKIAIFTQFFTKINYYFVHLEMSRLFANNVKFII